MLHLSADHCKSRTKQVTKEIQELPDDKLYHFASSLRPKIDWCVLFNYIVHVFFCQ